MTGPFYRTTYVTVATVSRDRWFDLDAVRTEYAEHTLRNAPTVTGSTQGTKDGRTGTWQLTHAGAPPLDWHIDTLNPPPPKEEPDRMGNARLLIGDVWERLAELPDHTVDLIVTSPPFLALRSYLPADHPDKAKEIGSEPTPAAFLDTLLDLTTEFRRVLAPHGSICVELGDTYAGSGGAGGDYGEDGLRAGQPPDWSQRRGIKSGGRTNKPLDAAMGLIGTTSGERAKAHGGWPLDKCLTCIPGLYAASLAFGRNLLAEPLTAGELLDFIDWEVEQGHTAEEAIEMARSWALNASRGFRTQRFEPWRIRNQIVWARPNPPVGFLGDKFRPATSYVTVATMGRDRWFDLDAVRVAWSETTASIGRVNGGVSSLDGGTRMGSRFDTKEQTNPAGAPPLDWDAPDNFDELFQDALDDFLAAWWQPLLDLPTAPYKGAHYATFPPELPKRLIEAMCPREVCRECGRPRRRIVEQTEAYAEHRRAVNNQDLALSPKQQIPQPLSRKNKGWAQGEGHTAGAAVGSLNHITRSGERYSTLGWTDCGHDNYRPGLVLDPFAGSGTTLAVAVGCGRDAMGIDLDERNADLARERCGLFLTVEPA